MVPAFCEAESSSRVGTRIRDAICSVRRLVSLARARNQTRSECRHRVLAGIIPTDLPQVTAAAPADCGLSQADSVTLTASVSFLSKVTSRAAALPPMCSNVGTAPATSKKHPSSTVCGCKGSERVCALEVRSFFNWKTRRRSGVPRRPCESDSTSTNWMALFSKTV